MKTEHFTYLSSNQELYIHAVKWLPDAGNYHAIVQLTHGMIEYIERYTPFAEFLTDHGFMVVGHDHLGHGDSIRSTTDYGYFTKKNPCDTLVEDMHQLRTIVQEKNPDVPYFMFGHSMGSYLLRTYLAKHHNNLAGAIICGTGYVKPAVAKLGLAAVHGLKLIRGGKYHSKAIASFAFSGSYGKFDMTGQDTANSWLSKNPDNVIAYYSDPKCAFSFTLNGYQGLLESVLFSCQQANIDRIPNHLPILLISGTDDPVGDLGRGVDTVHKLLLQSGKTDVTYHLYHGYRHEILNELGKEQVYDDVLQWLQTIS